ncbi:MAG: hypothetical protein U0Q19_06970 [Kineosporiaceae bacterium]
MTVTPTLVTRAAAAASVAAGAIFIGVQIKHPHLDITSITTTEMLIRGSLKVVMAALAVAGITGMYLSRIRRNGLLGLIGYVALAAGYLLIMSTAFAAAYVVPHVAGSDPSFTRDVIAVATSKPVTGDLGALGVLWQAQGYLYLVGGTVFGIALFRARVLARWATVLLAIGGLVSAALSMMPDAFYRLLAFPNGVAMIGLGYSLWRVAGQDGERTGRVAEARREQAAV